MAKAPERVRKKLLAQAIVIDDEESGHQAPRLGGEEVASLRVVDCRTGSGFMEDLTFRGYHSVSFLPKTCLKNVSNGPGATATGAARPLMALTAMDATSGGEDWPVRTPLVPG